MLNLIKRDSILVKAMAERDVVLQETCQVSTILRRADYANIALQKITFTINGKEYHIDHIWLQQRDYPSYFRSMAKEGEWYDIDFVFYQYRDKKQKNADGIMMHGMDVLDIWELTDEEIIKTNEEIFSQAENVDFAEF